MRTLLVNPPFMRFLGREQNYPPLGLAYLGTHLRDALGREVAIRNLEMAPAKLGLEPRYAAELRYTGYADLMDAHQAYLDGLENADHPIWREVTDALEAFEPDEVGITARSVQRLSALRVAEAVKRWRPAVKVVVGGVHATAAPADFVHPCVDHVVVGDSVLSNGFFIPDRDLFLEEYGREGLGHLLSSVGCPFHCTYCAQSVLWGHQVWYRSPQDIITEMAQINQRHGVTRFTFWDDCMTAHRSRVEALCRLIGKTGWTWRCDTRLDLLDAELLETMYAGGCRRMSVGMESGAERVLALMGKGETVEEVREKAGPVRALGERHPDFLWRLYVMVGFPTETEAEIRQTWELAEELGPDRVCLSTFAYYPGTAIWESAKANEWVDADGYRWEEHSHQTAVAGRPAAREFAAWVDEYNEVQGGWKGWIAE